jgi:hypothetical protein
MDAELRDSYGNAPTIVANTATFRRIFTLLPFQIDHVISEKHGGATTPQNLALSCSRGGRLLEPERPDGPW